MNVAEHAVVSRGDDYEHNTEDRFVQLDGPGAHQFALTTGNLIGCVKEGDYTLRVSSRFGDDFLKFIIADADGFIEVPEQGGYDKGGYDWLLIYLWTIKLRKAFRLGLPKTYETRAETLMTVRGRLDPVDYVLNNKRARYRCTYREHSYDNDGTRLIARTLQHLDGHAFLRDAHSLNQTFQIATQGHRHELRDLLATKLARNPYYADYNPVIALSKQILRNELTDIGEQSQTSAFFFDVSMLFEYFVRKLLKRAGVTLRGKNSQTWVVPTGRKQRTLVPDLVFEIGRAAYVFDVKYKSFDFREGVKREDVFQLHTYVGQLTNEAPVSGCGFIYPIRESRWTANGLEFSDGILMDSFTQGGRTIPFHVCFLKVPDRDESTGHSRFHASLKFNCAAFVRGFLAALGQSRAMAA
jgi:5-methylcytosine-specific restriction endonuclease McrBC regulatory subunit McrC